MIYLILFIVSYLNSTPTRGYWFVNYPDSECSSSTPVSWYFEAGCYIHVSPSETYYRNYDCDKHQACCRLYDGYNCSGTPSSNHCSPIGRCFTDPFFNLQTKVYCTKDFEVKYRSGMFKLPSNPQDPTISSSNPIFGQLYYPVGNVGEKCEASIFNMYNQYITTTCTAKDNVFNLTVYSDQACTEVSYSVIMLPGQVKDIYPLVGQYGNYYGMFNGCSN